MTAQDTAMTHALKLFDEYRADFMQVLYHLEEAGVQLHEGAGPAALGITAEEFNKNTLAAAVGAWRNVLRTKAEDPDYASNPIFNSVAAIINSHETLEFAGADITNDAGFSALGVSKAEFEAECRDIAQQSLKLLHTYVEHSASGGRALFNYTEKCLRLGGADPSQDTVYQAAGYASRAAFESELAAWEATASGKKHGHDCCGNGCHVPAPGGCGPN